MLHICQWLACGSLSASGSKATMAAVSKPTAEFLVANHGHDSHECMMFGTALVTHVGTVVSSLLVRPPSGIAGNCHDLASLRIDHDSTSPTTQAILLGLPCSCTGNREKLCSSSCIELSLNAAELIEWGSILQ